MRVVLVLALLFVASSASALPGDGQTVLGPAGGDASKGETMMNVANGNADSVCARPPCHHVHRCEHPPCPTKPMKPAKVEYTNQCPCLQDPICDCRRPQTVEPEIRPTFCGCIGQPNCGCSSQGQMVTTVRDECGCLHLQVCPCRPKFVAPEVRENHLEPELRENANNNDFCKCLRDPVCACRRIETVMPEIREPRCPCADTQRLECACMHLKPN